MVQKKQTQPLSQNSEKNRWQPLAQGWPGPLLLILLIALASAVTIFFLMASREPVHHAPLIGKKIPAPPQVFEIYPKENGLVTHPKPKPAQKATLGTLPKVAIIIDDIGYDKYIVKKFLSLDTPLTFSILPFSPFEKEISIAARERGIETMLHLPMEPSEYPVVNPGPGALLSSMTADELISQLEKDLQSVSNIKGVNNHMGSEMTQHSAQMHRIFSILKKQGLYFIDSRTTPKTLCKPSARMVHMPFAERDIFLDHIPTSDFIENQLKKLIRIAGQKGYAIGIGHPHPETHQVLEKMLPTLRKKVTLVPASQIILQLNG